MKSKWISTYLLALLAGVATIAIAQTTSQVATRTTATQETASQSSSSSGARSNANATANGSASAGMSVANGMINKQKVFVFEYMNRSSNSSSTDQMQQTIKDQDVYAQNLGREGKLIIAGQYMDDGNRMVTVIAESIESAKKLASESPLVKSGSFSVRIRELYVTHARGASAGGLARGQVSASPSHVTTNTDKP